MIAAVSRTNRQRKKPHRCSEAPILKTSRRALKRELRRAMECQECGNTTTIPARRKRAPGHRKHMHCYPCGGTTLHRDQ